MKNALRILVALGVLALIGLFAVDYRSTSSRGAVQSAQVIEIKTGENALDVGAKLQDVGIVSWQGYFIYYIWKKDLRHAIVAGKYQLNGSMAIPEITEVITRGEVVPKGVTVTFPEGWESRKIADRLTANALPGDAFLALVNDPLPEWRREFWFLQDLPENASLEGFLFPDTYTFAFDTPAEAIVKRMLSDFENKFPDTAKESIENQGKKVFDIVTMASIVETEVKTDADRRMVADIFWRRIAIGQPLQSDATVKYVRKESKVQHSFEETRVDSPYNTYVNKGLPPGPISNPGLKSMIAAIAPIPNDYFYFLSDTATGETVFSVTFDEHVRNKTQHGL
ncbi:MAG: endolytic transglycosylase MltG [Candidatus Moranbacteria bacterium]|nr:endolytic transglycosylase MltG [Candidatus Moranbacteria bacterium]